MHSLTIKAAVSDEDADELKQILDSAVERFEKELRGRTPHQFNGAFAMASCRDCGKNDDASVHGNYSPSIRS